MPIGDASRWSPPLAPGEPLRHLGELATGAGLVEAMAYAPGRSEGRHSHPKATLIYIAAGDHWAGDSRGGDICRAHTVRFLPAGEPHETYFPLGSTCLQVELEPAILTLAAEAGRLPGSPGEVRDPSAASLGVRLLRELVSGDDLSGLEVEASALQLLACGAGGGEGAGRAAPPWVLRVAELLREELHGRLTLSALAASVGRHPVQVSRAFHRYFRCTLSEYVRRARVARGQVLLSGVPPQRYRARMRGG